MPVVMEEGELGLYIRCTLHATLMQVDEKTTTVCKPAGYAEALTADEAEVSAPCHSHVHLAYLKEMSSSGAQPLQRMFNSTLSNAGCEVQD